METGSTCGSQASTAPASAEASYDGAGDSPGSAASASGFWATVINITKAFVGAASFALPKAFSDGGLVGASVGIVVLAFFSHFALSRLARCSHLVPGGSRPTYPAVGQAALGAVGRFLAWFGMLAMTLGVCGSYVVFMVTRLELVTGVGQDWGLCVVCVLVTLLSWLRSYRLLAYTSFFGILALVFALAVQCVDVSRQDFAPLAELEPFVRVDSYGKFLGNAGFLYLISTAILPLEQSMQEEVRPHFGKAMAFAMVPVTILNIVFAAFAYWGYGDCLHAPTQCVQGLVVDNLPPGTLTNVVNALLSVDLLFTCIVFLLPMSQLLEKELLDEARFGEWSVEIRRNVLRTLMVVGIAWVAKGVPVFDLLTGLSGGFGNNILGLILPPVFYVVLRWRHKASPAHTASHALELAACGVCFLFGLGFIALTLTTFVAQVSGR
uniref:Amino acid transporter transmembrane domain-containing protein n=1 Tax=Zooxanthella nutricula TaxID=1333877 RepID=A0A7S2Q7P2_9DINO